MSIAKVLGLETEYGIFAKGVDLSAESASSLLINAFLSRFDNPIKWDFVSEKPGRDARTAFVDEAMNFEVEMNLVNTVLTNGSRYYVDHAHPELSTPECRYADEAVLFDRAGEEIVRQSMSAAQQLLPSGAELIAYKNNSDGKGNSYGCHENYLVDRSLQIQQIAQLITAHFVTRQVFAGAGKVGSESELFKGRTVEFQLSQRADFFEEEIGLETTHRRPIINTRDEPHCNPSKYRRLHVIVGDANMSEVATFLKLGTTAILLAMIEDGQLDDEVVLANPVKAIREISRDVSLRQKATLISGRTMTALNVQEFLCDKAEQYAENFGLECVGESQGKLILYRWREVLDGLKRDSRSVAHIVDWVAKKQIIDGLIARHNWKGNDPRIKAIDLQYHDMRTEKCIALRAGLETMVDQTDVRMATVNPPNSTRAYFRSRCLSTWPQQVVGCNWDSVIFDLGRDALYRVPMAEPLRGTMELTQSLLDSCSTPSELIARLEDPMIGYGAIS